MSTPLAEITAFQRDVLTVLAANEGANGSELCRRLQEGYGEEITNPRFYPAVDGLIERGLVEKRQPNGRENAYALTEDGQLVLVEDLDWRVERLRGD